MGELNYLRPEDRTNLMLLRGLSGKDKEIAKRGLRVIGYSDPEAKLTLGQAFKRLHPAASDREISMMVNPDSLAGGGLRGAFQRLDPYATDLELDIMTKGKAPQVATGWSYDMLKSWGV